MSLLLAHQQDSSSSLISMQHRAPAHFKIPAVTISFLLVVCVPNVNVNIHIYGFDLGWIALPLWFLCAGFYIKCQKEEKLR